MEVTIGPYILSQRTEYSKVRLIDKNTKEDITEKEKNILEKILNDYKKQIENPDNYFIVGDDGLSITEATKELDYLFIPDNTKEIAQGGLRGKFFYVNLPPSLTIINNFAFDNCRFLKEIHIPDSVKTLSFSTFEDCEQLKYVKLSSSLTKLDTRTFYACNALEHIVLPDFIKQIDSYAFGRCINLSSIKLPNNLKKIDECVFIDCTKLENINLPSSLKSIGRCCFLSCASLKEIIIPDSVDRIESSAFAGCKSLETVKLPNDLRILKRDLFEECKSLKNITLPDSIVEMEDHIFPGTKKIENINIPRDLKVITCFPFAHSNIKSLTFNYNLEQLFASQSDLIGNSSINKLIINNSVKKITPEAFKCSGSQITSIDYLGTKEEFDKFKKHNNKLFDIYLTNIKEINFIERKKENSYIENLSI